MACNVFGTPVTVETLKGMPEYADKDTITRKDLAEVALALKNAEGKDVNARSYVENLYKRFEGLECVLGLIYNATGAVLSYNRAVDFYGYVAPAPYPTYIENGQWGAFVYFKSEDSRDGANGSVIYRGYDLDGTEIDFFMGWDNRVKHNLSKTFVEIGDADSYKGQGFNELRPKVENSGQFSSTKRGELLSTALIGSNKMAVLEIIHRLQLAPPLTN